MVLLLKRQPLGPEVMIGFYEQRKFPLLRMSQRETKHMGGLA